MLQTAEPAVQSPADSLEPLMLQLPQLDCPVEHHFGPGVYMRQVTIPAGAIAAGHCHKFDHLNILLTGAIALLNDSGGVDVLRAPVVFPGKPGRKIAYVIETVTWLNLFATEERDVDVLDATLVEKSDAWRDSQEAAALIKKLGEAAGRIETTQET